MFNRKKQVLRWDLHILSSSCCCLCTCVLPLIWRCWGLTRQDQGSAAVPGSHSITFIQCTLIPVCHKPTPPPLVVQYAGLENIAGLSLLASEKKNLRERGWSENVEVSDVPWVPRWCLWALVLFGLPLTSCRSSKQSDTISATSQPFWS